MEKNSDIQILQRIIGMHSSSRESAKEHCEHEIKCYQEQRTLQLENELKKIGEQHEKNMIRAVDKILQQMIERVELFNSNKKHSNDDHLRMIEALSFYHDLCGYFIGKKSETITRADELLTNLYATHHKSWRKIFGTKVEIRETISHFLRRSNEPLLVATM